MGSRRIALLALSSHGHHAPYLLESCQAKKPASCAPMDADTRLGWGKDKDRTQVQHSLQWSFKAWRSVMFLIRVERPIPEIYEKRLPLFPFTPYFVDRPIVKHADKHQLERWEETVSRELWSAAWALEASYVLMKTHHWSNNVLKGKSKKHVTWTASKAYSASVACCPGEAFLSSRRTPSTWRLLCLKSLRCRSSWAAWVASAPSLGSNEASPRR